MAGKVIEPDLRAISPSRTALWIAGVTIVRNDRIPLRPIG
jgi:hypothetical protein